MERLMGGFDFKLSFQYFCFVQEVHSDSIKLDFYFEFTENSKPLAFAV